MKLGKKQKKRFPTSRLAFFLPTRLTGNDFLLKGGLKGRMVVGAGEGAYLVLRDCLAWTWPWWQPCWSERCEGVASGGPALLLNTHRTNPPLEEQHRQQDYKDNHPGQLSSLCPFYLFSFYVFWGLGWRRWGLNQRPYIIETMHSYTLPM